MNQEQMMQLQMIEQEANQLNQQTELIEQNLKEIEELKTGLGEIEKKETKEILVNIGKRIFLPVEIKDKNLIVEVGNKNFVKKSIEEAKELIDEQICKLNSAREQITERLHELEMNMNEMISEMSEKSEKKHVHDENCKHEH
ncbi:MAG: prefoldin subunit alpha [Nanoarchaeota archaeon]